MPHLRKALYGSCNLFQMRNFTTLIFWAAILLLILWLGVPLLTDIFGLTLTDKRLSDFYHSTKYFVVPTAILLTLLKTLSKGMASVIEVRNIFLTVCAALLSVLVFSFGFFDKLCGSTTKSTLFINRQESSSKIFLREYGCGAVGSGPRNEIVRVDTVWNIFIQVAKIDTTQLDSVMWMRAPN